MPPPPPPRPAAGLAAPPRSAGPISLDGEPFDPESSLVVAPGPRTPLMLRARTLRPLIQAADERLPRDRVDAALEAARLDRDGVRGGTRWIDGAGLVGLLDTLRAACTGDAEWDRLCRARLRESLGPAAHLVHVRHPDTLFRLLSRTLPRVARGMHLHVVHTSAVTARIDLHFSGPDSPAFRAWRDALLSELSRVVGMPPGRVAALRRATDPGSDHDALLIRYPLTGRVTRLLLGLIGGMGAAAALGLGGHAGPVGMLAIAALGGALPLALEAVLSPGASARLIDDLAGTLAQLDDEATQAVAELQALHARERDWTRREQAAEATRLDDQQARLAAMSGLLSARETAARGVAHDLGNVLTILAVLPDQLRAELDRLGGGSTDARGLLDSQDHAVAMMAALLKGLRDAGSGDTFVPLTPEWVALAPLCADVDRRLAALTWGRDLAGRAMLSPTAPARVHIDPSALDRILDNLLTNATKYTESGSVRVELDGTEDGGLVLLVRDTGRGVAAPDQRAAFLAGGSNPSERAERSQGIGLSVVLRLVDQLGGTLSLRSAPGEGCRFTVRLPRDPPDDAEARRRLADSPEIRLDRVLRLLPL